MVYIIKDYKKKKIYQQFQDDVHERTSSVKRYYDDIVKESRKKEEELREKLRSMGYHGVKSFEVRDMEGFQNLERVMSMVRNGSPDQTQKIFKKVAKLRAIDEDGRIREY